jgi:hypothetical protein
MKKTHNYFFGGIPEMPWKVKDASKKRETETRRSDGSGGQAREDTESEAERGGS